MSEPLPPVDDQPQAEPTAPAAPGLGERLQEGRRTFQPGLWLRLTVVGIVVVYLILFVVMNARTVEVKWVFATTRVSLIWVIVFAGLIGLVVGVLVSQLGRHRARRRARS